MAAKTTDPTKPNYARPEVLTAMPLQNLIADLLEGTPAMHRNAVEYIHKWTDEKPEVWRYRSTVESLFEGFGRTVSAATGMLFAKPPAMEYGTAQATFVAHAENIDGMGNAFDVFAKRYAESAVAYGHALILVDHPTPPPGATADDEEPLNLRPVWRRYDRRAVLSWRTATIANRVVPAQIVFEEPTDVPAGDFGVTTANRYRLVRLEAATDADTGEVTTVAAWYVLELTAQGAVVPVGAGAYRKRDGSAFTRLPIAVGYAGRTDAPLVSKPPLAGVAYANLGHYQQATELRFGRSIAAIAQPVVTGTILGPDGQPTTSLPLGWLVGLHLSADSTFQWAEPAGKSFDQLKMGVEEKARDMAALGMNFLVRETRGVEAAEAKRIDATAENSTLATSADGIEDGLNMAWEFHAEYLGLEPDVAPVVTLNRDFDAMVMDPQTMAVYIKAVVEAGLPAEEFLAAWQRGGRIPLDADLTAIADQMRAQMEAEADRKEVEAEARTAELTAGAA